MKVQFIQASGFFPEDERSMPIGIMSLASKARQDLGADVSIYDMQIPTRSYQPVLDSVREFGPDVIGISGMTPDADTMRGLATEIKSLMPNVFIVAGGVHATNDPGSMLSNTAIDYVMRGEADESFTALLQRLAADGNPNDLPGLVYREGGEIRHGDTSSVVEDLDTLPFPAYDLVNLDSYYRIPRCGIIYAGHRYAAIVTSRGCPYQCAYCHKILGREWRARSPENIVAEMEQLIGDYGIEEFVIMDDLFNCSAKRIEQLADLIIEKGVKTKLSFPIGLRADIMTESAIRKLKRAGMYRCMYAIETASDRLQTLIRKHNKLDKIRKTIEYTREQGVMVHGTFMLGFPTETEEEARSTVRWALDSGLHTSAFYRVIPYSGTYLRQLAVEGGHELPGHSSAYHFHMADDINISAIDDRRLKNLRRRAYQKFYLSPIRLWNIFKLLPNRRRLLPQLAVTWFRKSFIW